MPIYPYSCRKCGADFDVAKTVANIDLHETCQCGSHDTMRNIASVNIERSSAGQPYYEPVLGCMINSKSHKNRILKERGLEEVGNTSPDTMYNNLEKEREKRIAKSWDDL